MGEKIDRYGLITAACQLPFLAFFIGFATLISGVLTPSVREKWEKKGWIVFMIDPSVIQRIVTGIMMMVFGTIVGIVVAIVNIIVVFVTW